MKRLLTRLLLVGLAVGLIIMVQTRLGGSFVGTWLEAGQRVQRLEIIKIRSSRYQVNLTAAGGGRQVFEGLVIGNGALELGQGESPNFLYLVLDEEKGNLHLLEALEMRTLQSRVKGGRISVSELPAGAARKEYFKVE